MSTSSPEPAPWSCASRQILADCASGSTLRRALVDEFQRRVFKEIPSDSKVLDLGGNQTDKRGTFDISSFDLTVTTVNISPAKGAHVLADAHHLPFVEREFDVVLCAELLEHVHHPEKTLQEVQRILRPGGSLVITAPFMYRIHADPHDHTRFTETHWRELLNDAGFDVTTLERQGLLWSVIANALQQWNSHREREGRTRLGRGLWRRIINGLVKRALKHDAKAAERGSDFHASFTTGFGIVARRKEAH